MPPALPLSAWQQLPRPTPAPPCPLGPASARPHARQYGRSLALVASKAPRPEWAAFLCRCGLEALEVELGFHEVRCMITSGHLDVCKWKPSPSGGRAVSLG